MAARVTEGEPLFPGSPADRLAREESAAFVRPHPPSVLSRVIYVSLAVLTLAFVALLVFYQTGILHRPVEETRTPWDLSIVFLAALITLGMGFVVGRRLPELLERRREEGPTERLATWELGVLSATLPASVSSVAAAFLLWFGAAPGLDAATMDPMLPVLVGGIGILLAFAPYGYFTYAAERHTRALEERFPDLLRDLNESHRAGMTMAQSIRAASKGDYGRLNPEVRRMAQQVSWGTPFADALDLFAERVGTPTVARATSLIIKATRAGGNVGDVLAAAARDAREIKTLEKERRINMALYVVIIYVSFAVFLGVTAALQGLLIPSMLTATAGLGGMPLAGMTVSARLTLTDFEFIYFGVGVVQALGSGMVAGVMSEGTLAAGFKHSAVLLAATILVLGFAL